MVSPNLNIPTSFQMPDITGSILRGQAMGQQQQQVQQGNALAAGMAQHGTAALMGDQNALSHLDLGTAMRVQDHQASQRQAELVYEKTKLQLQQLRQQLTPDQAAAARQEFEQGAQMVVAAQTPEQFAQLMQRPGFAEAVEQFVGPGMATFENRSIIAAAAMGAKDALELTNPQAPDEPDSIRALRIRAEEAGLQPGTPQYQQFMAEASGQRININMGDQGPRTGPIPPGMMLVEDPNAPGGLRMAPIADGPVEQEAIQGEEQAFRRDQQRARAGSTVIQDLQRGLDLLPELGAIARGEGVTGGIARTSQASIPGTVANRITQFTESALSNVGLDTLQQMRENSPTGGALGQVPIQQQQRLEQVLGSLNINQPPSVLEANIKRVMNIYTDIIYGSPEERARSIEQGRMTPDQNAEIESFYYELPFDERGRPVDQGRERQPTRATAQTIQQMSADDLLSLDVMSLDEAGLEAFERRLQELGR